MSSLKNVLRQFILSKNAGVSSTDQLLFELNQIRTNSTRVLIFCAVVTALLLVTTFYFAFASNNYSFIVTLLAADGAIAIGLVETARRAYKDLIGVGYLLSVVHVSTEAQISKIITSILKHHFGEALS